MEYKKAIGPVVAVALLIVVSVVSVIGFQTWLGTYSSEIFSNAEIQSQSSTESTSIEALVGDQLYIKGENVSVKEVLIDGIKCNISVNISGIENVGLSDCLNSVTSKTPEITVVTNNKVIIKKIYLKDIEVNSSSSSSGVNPVYTDTFISVWDTRILSSGEFPNPSESSNSSSITLPLVEGGTYNFFVD